jgi:hypothetical protein
VAQLKEKSPDREAEALNRSHQLREGTERLVERSDGALVRGALAAAEAEAGEGDAKESKNGGLGDLPQGHTPLVENKSVRHAVALNYEGDFVWPRR